MREGDTNEDVHLLNKAHISKRERKVEAEVEVEIEEVTVLLLTQFHRKIR